MDFRKYLHLTTEALDLELDQILRSLEKEVKEINPQLSSLIKLFIDSCQGGKRIRGGLVKLGYEMGKSSVVSRQSSDRLKADSEAILETDSSIFKVAAAYEIFHSAILAHDDVIDVSAMRRGKPSLYKALGGDHYGISQAICLGDLGFFLATKTIAETNFPADIKNQAVSFFAKVMMDTALGEMLDVEKGEVLTIMRLKTGQYTISGPLQMGAILAGADQGLLDKLGEFGENLGIAYQIQDDILGVFGEEEQIGKSVTSDIEEGKNTLLLIQALAKSDPNQKAVIKKYYGQSKIDINGLAAIRKVFEETGSLQFAKAQSLSYAKKAMKILPEITKDQSLNILLQQMAEYLIERNK